MSESKIPKVKVGAEIVKAESDEYNYIEKTFETDNGSKGIWQYGKMKDESMMRVNMLIIGRNKDNAHIAIAQREILPCTHEQSGLIFLHAKISKDEDEVTSALKLLTNLTGLKKLEIMEKTESGFYSDPWKSNEKVLTLIFKTDEIIDSNNFKKFSDDNLEYVTFELGSSAQELIRVAEEK